MKISIDIDCTPQEARTFFGLPNIEPMQEVMVNKLEQRMSEYLDALEPEALLKLWFPGGSRGLEQVQQQFWSQLLAGLGAAATRSSKPRADDPDR